MKRHRFVLGIMVFLTIFCFVLAGCDNGATAVYEAEAGILTITDIPTEYNGRQSNFTAQNNDQTIFIYNRGFSPITNGEFKVTLYDLYTRLRYERNETIPGCVLTITTANPGDSGGGLIAQIIFPPITFINGSATVSARSAEIRDTSRPW